MSFIPCPNNTIGFNAFDKDSPAGVLQSQAQWLGPVADKSHLEELGLRDNSTELSKGC